MARFRKGILGGFSGKVGNVVGGNWKGIDYMRSLGKPKKGGFSQAQLAQQEKFKTAAGFLQPFAGLLKLSFRDYAVEMTGMNNALRYVLQQAITGTYPSFSILYDQVLVSRGDLPNGGAPSTTLAGTTLSFSWTNNSGTGKAQDNDQALLVAYCPTLNQVEWLLNSAQRVDGTGSLPLSTFAGMEVQSWIGFISADGRSIANSRYTGAFTL